MAGSGFNMYPTTAVLWDLNTCPVPADCEPGRIRASIEWALTKYFGGPRPVIVFAFCNLEYISPVLLKEISFSGILLRHTVSRGLGVFDFLRDWKKRNPPPAKIMLISSDSAWFDGFSHFGYTFLRAFTDSRPPFYRDPSDKEWFWESLLKENLVHVEPSSHILNDEPAGFCMLCETPSQSCDDFIKHLKSTQHREELLESAAVDDNDKPFLFCELCEYPGCDDYNMDIHYKSEEHAQKEKEAAGVTQKLVAGPSEFHEKEAPLIYQPNTTQEDDCPSEQEENSMRGSLEQGGQEEKKR